MAVVTQSGSRHISGAGTTAEAWHACGLLAAVPFIAAAELVPPGARAIIVAPHPDDETLACGGLIQALHAAGRDVRIMSVTDGNASHPGSALWPPAALAERRAQELRAALDRLGMPALAAQRLHVPDGAVAQHEAALHRAIAMCMQPGDVLLTTWRFDGHPDHEACGRACAAAAAASGNRLIEFPVWAWHWATPDSSALPWPRARKLLLAPDQKERKRRAAAAFCSQTEERDHDGPVLPQSALARLVTHQELYFL
ncbi:PIG-L deacetylase family protein [Massilia aquatica]|uniref:PIG-L family deacetylase n=1 Tax=Massilia aquatica TaxID=2609000 RepID=A0ABX0MAQ7_9BURK|nr:PIG-L family deacetylase [Massilia aquatica]NHZ41617.1 PIG-L family deacetylase [Massilia aquatica]